MTPNGNPASPAATRRPSNLWLIIVAALFIIVPFLTWYLTWFGRPLSDEKIAEYLADENNPRHIQHALLQIEERIERGDAGSKKFYPQIVASSKSSVPEVRKAAAGRDVRNQDAPRELGVGEVAIRRRRGDSQIGELLLVVADGLFGDP